MWWFIALFVASLISVYLWMPRPETAKPPEVQEVDIASVEDGKTIPILFGTRNTESFNVVWWGDVQTRSWEDDLVIGYYYFVGIHAVLFHGPIDNISHIISDDKLAWSGENTGGELCIPKTSADLYGGKDRGGGFGGMAYGGEGLGDFDGSGCIDIDMGYPDQVRNWYLEHNLDGGDAVGDTGAHEIPAFRGIVGAILKRVYIGTSPNLRKLSFRGQRVHVRQDGIEQWYDEKSEIPVYCSLISEPEENDKWRILITAVGSAADMWPRDPWKVTLLTLNFYDSSGNRLAKLPYVNNDNGDCFSSELFALEPCGFAVGKLVPVWSEHWGGKIGVPDIHLGYHFTSEVSVDSFSITAYTSDLIGNWGSNRPDEFELQHYSATLGWETVSSHIANWEQFDNQSSDTHTTQTFYAEPEVDEETSPTNIDYGIPKDLNPAHIIRECLTDPDWGMGGDEGSPDETSFIASANTLYDEGMGISIKWTAQTPIDDFVDLIKKHINAELYPDHSTGKQILKLIRDDYSVASLVILGEDDIVKIDNAKRPLIGELINSVTVQYWDTCINKDASVVVVDQSLVQMQGATINTTIQYPGFTNKRIATLAATRDLRVLSSQLLSCTLYVKRTAEELNLGSVFVLHWPDLEIDGIVMRVQGIDFGTGRQNTIKLDVVEDVFGLPATVVVGDDDNDPGWTNPSQPPTPVAYQIASETPYYNLVQSLGQLTTDSILSTDSGAGYASMGAVRPGNAINGIMVIDSGGGYVDDGVINFCGTLTLAVAVDQIEKVWSYDTVIDIALFVVGSFAQIDNELVRIDAIDTTLETITVGRAVLDTSPRAHAIDARLYGWGSNNRRGSAQYTDSDSINIKVKPVTGVGVLDIDDATAETIAMDSRAIKPYPPGNLQINDVAYPTNNISSDFTATWAHRDRLIQGITPHTDGDTGPETGTTYVVQVFLLQTKKLEYLNIAGTSQLVDISELPDDLYELRILAERASASSWQYISWEFNIVGGTFVDTNILLNGYFDTDLSEWSNGNAWWVWDASGRAYHAASSAANIFEQAITSFKGAATILFDLDIISGTVSWGYRNAAGTFIFVNYSAGTHNDVELNIIDGVSSMVGHRASGYTPEFYLDNARIYKKDLINGDFSDSFTGWINASSYWTIVSGRAYHAATSTYYTLEQYISEITGSVTITFDLEVVQGGCQFGYVNSAGSWVFPTAYEIGTYTNETIVAPAGVYRVVWYRKSTVVSEMYLDNVSIATT